MTQTIPKLRTMGTGEIPMAIKPMEVESIAYRTEGPVFVIVVITDSSIGARRLSSSKREWNWIA